MLPGFGVSPILFSLSPKIEDPPQEEWGLRGLTEFWGSPPHMRDAVV